MREIATDYLQELKDLPQWLGWKYVGPEEKRSKVPINCNEAGINQRASVSNPETWGTYDEAHAKRERHWELAGVGFVLTDADPYVCIDLDHCFLEGGKLTPLTEDILGRFPDTYTEWSPSGRGLHIWIRGSIPTWVARGKRNKPEKGIEIYDSQRYMTVTFRAYAPFPIADHQAALDALYRELSPEMVATPQPQHHPTTATLEDDTVIELALIAKNGEKFERLLHGVCGDYDEDKSKADAAFLGILKQYTQDREQLARLWKRSKLYRDKLEREDYVNRTLDSVLTGVAEMPAERPTRLASRMSAEELWDADIPPTRYILPGLLPEGLTVLAAKPKIGKSWLALLIALRVTEGAEVLGATTEPGDVLYLALEDNMARLRQRMHKLNGAKRASKRLDIQTSCKPLDGGGLLEIETWLRDHPQAKLIIIDTFAKVRGRANNRNGNVYTEDYAAISPLQALAGKYGVSILLVHHMRKMGGEDIFDTISGSLGLTGAADSNWVLVRERGKADAVLHVTGRDIIEGDGLALQFDRETCIWSVLGLASEVRRTKEQRDVIATLEAAGEPLTPTQVADRLGININTAKQRLYRMSQDGLIESTGDGKYICVPPIRQTSILS